MKGLLHCFVFLLLGGVCSAGQAGKQFATAFMQNAQFDQNASFQIEAAALPNATVNTVIKVKALGQTWEMTAKPRESAIFVLPKEVEMIGSNKNFPTVLIEANQDITVLALNYKTESADTSVVYPVKEWGTEYLIFTPKSTYSGTFKKEFSIINYDIQNKVEIQLTANVNYQEQLYSAGTTLKIDLQPFETIQIQSEDDLSGTSIVSNLPVGVLTGHACALKYTTCDHVYEQLLPVSNWGNEFVVAPLPFHSDVIRHDSVYLQASQYTLVKYNDGADQIGELPMIAGQIIELFSKWPNALYIKADKGIQVLFEFNGGPKGEMPFYDPFLMNILPTDQFTKAYSLRGQNNFVNGAIIIARTTDLDGLTRDEVPFPSGFITWYKVSNSEYSWAELTYGQGLDYQQLAHPTSLFGVYSFGVALSNGYGSPGSGSQFAKKTEKNDCSSTSCSKEEECKMKDNNPVCVKKANPGTGTCWAMGDPHYRTFDGRYFNFMGNCTYTVAKSCNPDNTHQVFEVEAQNKNRGSSKITSISNVFIKVYGYSITLVRSEFGLVRMNYTLWNLPIHLGNVRLYQSGFSVIIETDFGLTVQYDWEQYLVVTVPGRLGGQVCGLCGNFNGKQEDDFTTPSGTVAKGVAELGNSWRVSGPSEDIYCGGECTGQCDKCTTGFLEHLAEKAACALLTTVMNGPFHECNAVIDPKVFYENCQYDLCMGEGVKKFMCDTLQVYASACQRAGVKILDWRSLAHCPEPACPENSHFELCGSACPATCEDPDAPSKCKANCIEACTCDQGFVHSGNKCVPQFQCGCVYKGFYIEAGASFWEDAHCISKCTCNGGNRTVECKVVGCPLGQECLLENEVRGCHPKAYSFCMVSGDPHYRTFDGHHYDFQGTCVYQMAGVCTKDTALEPFDVFVQNDGRGKKVGSSAKLVEVKVYGYSIVVSREHKGVVMLNGELTNLPFNLDQGKIIAFRSGGFAVIQTNFGLQVSFDWYSSVNVRVPNTYAGAMCGLCGNNNQNQEDDMIMKDGKQATSPEAMGKSWRVAEIPGCVHGCKDSNNCPDCDITQKQKYETKAFCGLITDPTGPFRNCHAKVDPSSYFNDCVYDVCLNNGNMGTLCSSLHTYTIQCQQKGAEVFSWRSTDFCEFKHPAHSHYEICANGCPATCDSLSPPSGCKALCQEGWACDEGFILSGDQCVPLAHCGCLYKGRYYKNEQVFYPNGLCEQECMCNGTVDCVKFSCGANEKCEVKNGVRACHPVGNGVCSISGDPHYTTFDNSHYNFQGTCTYTAAQACNIEGTHLIPFSVVVENEKWYAMSEDPKVSVAKLVAVEVYGNTLILRRNQVGIVMLNGAMTTIPLNIDEGAVQLYQEGQYYVILTNFGLRVTYDLVYHVTVTVPSNYKDKTCGLCGNFNDNKEDEFQLPDGKVTKDITSFGAAWKVSVPGVVCDDGCSGDFCPKCDSTLKHVFEADCSIITNPQGPFASCHNVINPDPYYRDCVYDVCVAEGVRSVLCNSISAYMIDCQDLSVTIKNWRTADFCPLVCPTNSYYQICAETCATPCPGLTDTITCPITCAEGCACNSGYYFNGTGCVSRDQCSCYHLGRTYKIGESILSEDCEQLCTCLATGDVQCVSSKCEVTEMCEVKNGMRGCYPKQCLMEVGGAFSLFNGRTGSITSDGDYEMIKLCDPAMVEQWFRVVVRLEACQETGQRSVKAVYVFFHDMMLSVNYKHETWVNGRPVTLPNMPKNDISWEVSEDTLMLERSGLRVTYSLSQEVSVIVREDLAEKVCGACGNLTPGFVIMNPALQLTMTQYMTTWIARDFSPCGL